MNEREIDRPEVSVVCPFYNEQGIIEEAVRTLIAKLKTLETTWELIVVNDGSLDQSRELVAAIVDPEPNARLVSYAPNRGRGYALRQGIANARGDIIVTTEIDLSWGEDIVHRLYAAMKEHADADIVVASPHLDGGGYKNVPKGRVFVSQLGNWVIRACMTNAASMNTGMTRAYRREVIQEMPLEENRKEFHLEVILKAQAFQHRIREIPALLEWKEYKHQGREVKRKSSSKVNKLIVTHSLFSIFANPIRYVWALAGVSLIIAAGFLGVGTTRYVLGLASPEYPVIYQLIIGLSMGIISLVFFTFGVIAAQANTIQKEIWYLQRDLRRDHRAASPAEPVKATESTH